MKVDKFIKLASECKLEPEDTITVNALELANYMKACDATKKLNKDLDEALGKYHRSITAEVLTEEELDQYLLNKENGLVLIDSTLLSKHLLNELSLERQMAKANTHLEELNEKINKFHKSLAESLSVNKGKNYKLEGILDVRC